LLDSVKTQDHKNWELFVIDDGSDDGTHELFQEQDHRIKYIQYQNNCGHPAALFNSNVFNLITGDLVIFIGSDDYFYDDAFSVILEKFRTLDCNIWKVGFLWKGEGRELQDNKHFQNYNEKLFISNEVLLDSYIQRDFLFVYRKIYWEKFSQYFISENNWFEAFIDVSMNNLFYEKHYPIYLLTAGWGADNITKGLNADKYFLWAFKYKLSIYEKYNKKMGKNYLHNLKISIARSSLLISGNRKISLNIIKSILKEIVLYLIDSFFLMLMLLIPPRIVFWVKKILFKLRKQR